jgi:hypothetical protein
VVAVGNLAGLWTDLPENISDRETLVRGFEAFFGWRWSEVVVRGGLSFAYHQHWNAYIAVSGLEPCSGLPLPLLLQELRLNKAQVYQVLVG